ncbi:MAG: cation transporter [Lachnospiraceae bacterium]|nr:cation transporter [Lachnospiraceae bacterium]
MFKITLDIDGMACGMCEAHVNEAVRKVADVKKVTSSHSKGRTEILSETEIDETKLREAIEATGYRVLSVKTEPYEKKGFSLFHKK